MECDIRVYVVAGVHCYLVCRPVIRHPTGPGGVTISTYVSMYEYVWCYSISTVDLLFMLEGGPFGCPLTVYPSVPERDQGEIEAVAR